jgi:hypothetical protein
MLSTRLVIVIGSIVLGFDTVTVNVNVPPGAASLGGLAAFVTPITGIGSTTVSFAALQTLATAG